MAENGNGTLKSRLLGILAAIIVASIVGYGSSMLTIGGYKRQIEINTAVLSDIKPKMEKIEAFEHDMEWIKKALEQNNVDHQAILAVLMDLKKKGR